MVDQFDLQPGPKALSTGVDDADGGGRDGQLSWRGTTRNDVDPREWGTLVCSPVPAEKER
jgi:hypothetical protein